MRYPLAATLRAMTKLDALRGLAAQVQEATKELDALRQKREEKIRDVRRSTDHTVAEIAAAAGVSEATVKTIIRGLARER
jgi:DNA-binding MurR/RpiR family transcriptional regulator